MLGAVLEVVNLRRHFTVRKRPSILSVGAEITRAVDGVSFRIQRGETFGLVGESGCGKTTLARCVLRLLEPSAGEIFYQRTDLLSLPERELRLTRKAIQAVFQDPYESLNPRMRVRDIVEEPLVIHRLGDRRERRSRVLELLNIVGLDREHAFRYPRELSGGQRQRVALARALSTRPEFLVADEPLSSLDVPTQAQILNLLQGLRRDFQLTMLFISHALPLVRHLCDRTAVMYRGRLVEVAATGEIFSHPLHPYTQCLLQAAPQADPGRRRERVDRHSEATFGAFPTPGELREASPGHWVAKSHP